MGEGNALLANLYGAQGISEIGGGITQGIAANAQGKFQKQQLDFNAQLLELQAKDAVERGNKDIAKLGKQGKKIIGAQRAALAGQNVDVSYGSAREVQQDTREQIREDLDTIKNNAWREAWGYQTAAVDARSQGIFAKAAGQTAATASIMTGGMNSLKSFTYSSIYAKKAYEDYKNNKGS